MLRYYPDTDPKIEQMQIDLIRMMPSWRKFAAVDDLNETVRALATSGIKEEYPNASPAQIRRILADRILGPELAAKVYDNAG